jgi:hypothetical protein
VEDHLPVEAVGHPKTAAMVVPHHWLEEVGDRHHPVGEEVHHQNPAAQEETRQFPLGRVTLCKRRHIPVMQTRFETTKNAPNQSHLLFFFDHTTLGPVIERLQYFDTRGTFGAVSNRNPITIMKQRQACGTLTVPPCDIPHLLRGRFIGRHFSINNLESR